MAELRPQTNLVVPEHLKMDPKQLKDRFLYVYAKGYVGLPPVFITKLWASTLFPSIANDKDFGTNRKGVRTAVNVLEKSLVTGLLSIKKVMDPTNPYFIASVPVYQFHRDSSIDAVSFLRNWFLGLAIQKNKPNQPIPPIPEPEEVTFNENSHFQERLKNDDRQTIHNMTVAGSEVLSNMRGLDANGREQLSKTLLQMRVASKGSSSVIYLDFKIDADIAQQLTSTPMIELRTVDLYPLLLTWVNNGWGYKEKPPTASFPISAIAATVPKGLGSTSAARINVDGISVAPNGKPFYLPRELDQTQRYEDLYIQAGSRGDNTFSLVDVNEQAAIMESGEEPAVKLPKNIPVFIDWLNCKYAFTTTTGMMDVKELVRYRAANETHIVNMANRFEVDTKIINAWMLLGEIGGVARSAFQPLAKDIELPPSWDFTRQFQSQLNDARQPQDWFEVAQRCFEQLYDKKVTLTDISTGSDFAPFHPLARYLKLVDKGIAANLDAVYNKYSVSYVSSTYPWIIMVSRYSDDWATVKAKDATLREAATNQGVDPNWTPPPIPLASNDGIKFLPHQTKVRNLLRNSPDYAILPVQAGGGKSVLSITDILYEIAANRSSPYLIMCPGHLVANYVKEIVFFTSGKVNAIPINSFAISQNGWARLEAMMVSAPRNTVVVCDYDALTYRAESLCYGTTPVAVYPVISFLRQFGFGYAMLDESQKVKNKSQRTNAAAALIVDIPKKRLASGTMVHDGPADLAMQMSMLDPTIFGTPQEFKETYGDKISGDRVISWVPGFAKLINDKIKANVVVAGANRKEWAALLPPKDERIIGVTLRPEQKRVYDLIFAETLEQIKEAAKSNKALQKFLQKSDLEDVRKLADDSENNGEGPTDEEGDELDDKAEDEDGGEAVANALRPYLARIEQFTGSPGSDPLGKEVLHGEDLLSPKVAKCHERINAHIFGAKIQKADGTQGQYGPFPGKVLVFTSYDATAEAIFNSAPEHLKACGLLYKASSKMEDGDRFMNDDSIKWMVGISTSMEEGLNFQFCSRLIRMEGIWNPGQLEQGNSRINRPELKKAQDERDKIFYDWIVANLTIDVTKLARLISKIIAVAKYENADNPEFEQLDDLPVLKMSLDTIEEQNDYFETLMPYNEAYASYRKIRDDEYKQYRDEYRQTYGHDPKLVAVPSAPNPPDVALMKRVPYVPGMGIYGEDQEGLMRLDTYLKSPLLQEDFEKAGIEKDEVLDPSGNKALLQLMKGRRIHTQYGDGWCRSINTLGMQDVIVDLDEGYSVRARWSTCFLLLRTTTSTKDIRDGLLKQIGDLPIAAPVEVPADAYRQDRKDMKRLREEEEKKKLKETKKRQKDLQVALSVELQLTVINGFLGILYVPENDTATKALQALGFRPTPQYYYAQFKRAKQLKDQFDIWQAKGFTFDDGLRKQGVTGAIGDLYNLLKSGGVAQHKETYQWATTTKIRNFYRLEQKASNDKKAFKPYPIVQDGAAYIALPIQGQSASKMAIKYKATGVVWHQSSEEMTYFGMTPAVTAHMLKQIEEAGFAVSNMAELKREFAALKKMKVRQGKPKTDAGEAEPF